MSRNIFAPQKKQTHQLIIHISSGQPPVLYPICASDSEYEEIVRQAWSLVKNGQLLNALESCLEN